jgi:hypothetical protein
MNDACVLTRSSAYACLAGGGEMGALMRSMDWAATPIGPVDAWSPALRTMVRLILSNGLPTLLWWGPKFCQLYNDAFRPLLGSKHPRSMGQPASQCWPEIWGVIGPLIETPFRLGSATQTDDIVLAIDRGGKSRKRTGPPAARCWMAASPVGSAASSAQRAK